MENGPPNPAPVMGGLERETASSTQCTSRKLLDLLFPCYKRAPLQPALFYTKETRPISRKCTIQGLNTMAIVLHFAVMIETSSPPTPARPTTPLSFRLDYSFRLPSFSVPATIPISHPNPHPTLLPLFQRAFNSCTQVSKIKTLKYLIQR